LQLNVYLIGSNTAKSSLVLLKIVDCRWGNYATWSECTKTCGGGTRFTTRKIEKEAEHGGLPCVGGEIRTVACNKDSCPGKKLIDQIR
jgi:hypothetical protein